MFRLFPTKLKFRIFQLIHKQQNTILQYCLEKILNENAIKNSKLATYILIIDKEWQNSDVTERASKCLSTTVSNYLESQTEITCYGPETGLYSDPATTATLAFPCCCFSLPSGCNMGTAHCNPAVVLT